jgi:hypothetical protein
MSIIIGFTKRPARGGFPQPRFFSADSKTAKKRTPANGSHCRQVYFFVYFQRKNKKFVKKAIKFLTERKKACIIEVTTPQKNTISSSAKFF